MTKRVFALMLALLLLCTMTACSPEDDVIDDPVINIGVQTPTYKDSHGISSDKVSRSSSEKPICFTA